MQRASLYPVVTPITMSPSRPFSYQRFPRNSLQATLNLWSRNAGPPKTALQALDLAEPLSPARRKRKATGSELARRTPLNSPTLDVEPVYLLPLESYNVDYFPSIVIPVKPQSIQSLPPRPPRPSREVPRTQVHHHHLLRTYHLKTKTAPLPPVAPNTPPVQLQAPPRPPPSDVDVPRHRQTLLRVVERPQHLMIYCVLLAMIEAGKLDGELGYPATISRRRMRRDDNGGGRRSQKISALRYEVDY